MRRRGFLQLLGGAVAGLALDPERALWVPGKKLISIPVVPRTLQTFTLTSFGRTIMIGNPGSIEDRMLAAYLGGMLRRDAERIEREINLKIFNAFPRKKFIGVDLASSPDRFARWIPDGS